MRKYLFFGISAALLLALGLTIISCKTTGNTEAAEDLSNILIITEIEGYTGTMLAAVSSTAAPLSSMTAVGRADVSENTVTIPLVPAGQEEIQWKETGGYFIILVLQDDNNAIYFYSGGETSAHKYNFESRPAEIPFSHFNRN